MCVDMYMCVHIDIYLHACACMCVCVFCCLLLPCNCERIGILMILTDMRFNCSPVSFHLLGLIGERKETLNSPVSRFFSATADDCMD